MSFLQGKEAVGVGGHSLITRFTGEVFKVGSPDQQISISCCTCSGPNPTH